MKTGMLAFTVVMSISTSIFAAVYVQDYEKNRNTYIATHYQRNLHGNNLAHPSNSENTTLTASERAAILSNDSDWPQGW